MMPTGSISVFPDATRLSVFGIDGRQGNPVLVSYCPQTVSDAELQAAASRQGCVEASFITGLEPSSVRFFTPVAELPLCVHGLLGAGACLAASDDSQAVKLMASGREYQLTVTDKEAAVRIDHPIEIRDEADPGAVLDVLHLQAHDLVSPMVVASAGSSKWLVHVSNLHKLLSFTPSFPELARISRLRGVNGVYAFTTQDILPGTDLAARGFNPAAGVDEDAATGVAAAAAVWTMKKLWPDRWVVVHQYIGAKQSGRIRVRAENQGTVHVAGEVHKQESR
jgi:trans-2,3-dihydro-3-hydroxyanthranilate isomerase